MVKTTTLAYGENKSVELTVTNVKINGDEKEVIPAFTKYSTQRAQVSKNMEMVEVEKLLPTVFVFTEPTVFREGNIKLVDYQGNEIPQEVDDKVLVYLDKADNLNLFEKLTEPLPSVVIECDSVEEAYQRVATTYAMSQVPQKRDWIGLCEATTGENLFSQIREFAMERKMPATTAQAYFGLRFTVTDLKESAISKTSPFGDKITYRQKEEATKLYEALKGVLGVKPASKTRYAKGLNSSLSRYTVEQVVEALWDFPTRVVNQVLDAPSESKGEVLAACIGEYVKKGGVQEAA